MGASGARYSWVEGCDCFPAGIAVASVNSSTTLSEDLVRLSRLRDDDWLDWQTSSLGVQVAMHSPGRDQLALITIDFVISDAGWLTSTLTTQSTPNWQPMNAPMLVASCATMLLWGVQATSELSHSRAVGFRMYLRDMFVVVDLGVLLLILACFVRSFLLFLEKKDLLNRLQADKGRAGHGEGLDLALFAVRLTPDVF